MEHDPQEDDPIIGEIINKAHLEAEAELKNEFHGIGFCHLLWGTQKSILKEKYNIDWKTPSEMNPNIIFD